MTNLTERSFEGLGQKSRFSKQIRLDRGVSRKRHSFISENYPLESKEKVLTESRGYYTPKQKISSSKLTEIINEVMKNKIKEFKRENPQVFLAFPKVESKKKNSFCIECQKENSLTSVYISAFEDFEEERPDGTFYPRRKNYITPEPELVFCENCGFIY